MTRLRGGVPALVVLGFAALAASPAAAKLKRHHPVHPLHARVGAPLEEFPTYTDRGSDRNPGGDNLYFSDTRNATVFDGPNLVGPAYFQRWWSTTY